MQKLFIHIGTHKTGSTAVQRALRMAKDDLIKEGIVFIPELFFSERSIGLISNWDMNVINECRQFLLKETESYRHLKNYRFVISYEGFSGYALNGFSNTKLVAKYLREITRDFDVFIVVYLINGCDYFFWYSINQMILSVYH